jgi:hypothetical protein
VQVVEVAEGTVYALPAVAIRGLLAGAVDAQPGADLPRLVTPQLAPGATHHVANTPAGRFRFPASRGADAVSSLFMASAVSGEVVSDVELEGSTQWLLAFPTKNAYVADVPGSLAGSGPVQPPFRERFATDGSCEPAQAAEVDVRGWQRHIDVPLQPFDYQLCAQVNLQGFDTSDGGGSDLVRFDDTPQRQIEAEREDGTPVRLKGLPVVGWRLSRFSNAAAQPGVLASYTVAACGCRRRSWKSKLKSVSDDTASMRSSRTRPSWLRAKLAKASALSVRSRQRTRKLSCCQCSRSPSSDGVWANCITSPSPSTRSSTPPYQASR